MNIKSLTDKPDLSFLSATSMGEGATGHEIAALQKYLQHLGYLNIGTRVRVTSSDAKEAAHSRVTVEGKFDEATVAGLSHYQRYLRLKPTGRLDSETVNAMKLPRCGNRDILRTRDVTNNPWGKTLLTFQMNGIPTAAEQPDMDNLTKCEVAFEYAFMRWREQANINMRFRPVSSNSSEVGQACTDCPPTGAQCGMLYDESEQWSFTPQAGQLDVVAFAFHECGHALGLCEHSSNPDALMFATIPNGRRQLLTTGVDNDLDRILALYPTNP
jgi:hypothetical protein